jgi:hypothetical protein
MDTIDKEQSHGNFSHKTVPQNTYFLIKKFQWQFKLERGCYLIMKQCKKHLSG